MSIRSASWAAEGRTADTSWKTVVYLEVIDDPEAKGVEVDLDPDTGRDWMAALWFGIEYALEHLPPETLGREGMRVRVREIEGDVGTVPSTAVLWCVIRAVWRALDHEPEAPADFDPKTGVLHLAQ